jgi:branched-chain amino acid transport system substrate-binding protein
MTTLGRTTSPASGTCSARYGDLVREAGYEVTDATVDSQIVALRDGGASALVTAATPKFAAQAIRRVSDLGWRPLHCLSYTSSSIAAVMEPAGVARGTGIVTAMFVKDSTDPAWANDPGLNEWRAFMARYMPEGDLKEGFFIYAYAVGQTLLQVLQQCGQDVSRVNIMRQATSLKGFVAATLLPGIALDTSPTNYRPIRQMQLARWTGGTWERFGDIIEGANV